MIYFFKINKKKTYYKNSKKLSNFLVLNIFQNNKLSLLNFVPIYSHITHDLTIFKKLMLNIVMNSYVLIMLMLSNIAIIYHYIKIY